MAISTPWVYQNLNLDTLARRGAPGREVWDGEHPEDWVANDLETVTLSQYPELQDTLERLAQAGARTQGMSGSGPTLFGLFLEAEAVQAAAARMREQFPGWLAVARGLAQGEGMTGWENQAWTI